MTDSGQESDFAQAWGCDRIIVVYEKLFLAECLKRVLQAALGAPVEIYASLDQIRAEGPEIRPQLVLFVSDTLETLKTFDALRQAAAIPKASVVVLSNAREPRLVRAVMQCGAKAYIPMKTGISVAIETVRLVLAGGTYFPAESLVETREQPVAARAPDPTSFVTRRELSIIQAIQQGKSNRTIAGELKLSESTVKVHIHNIVRKLGAKNRAEVAAWPAELAVAPERTRTAAPKAGSRKRTVDGSSG